jgi:hypothetical protein
MSDLETQTPNESENEEEQLRAEGETVADAFVRYQKRAVEEARLALEALIPPDFKLHGREAKRAFRKAFKVVLEEMAARLEFPEDEETEEEAPRASTTGKAKIKVEVN